MQSGTHVKKQLQAWDTLLEWRIRLQKLLVAANRLPQPPYWSVVATAGGQELQQAQSKATQSLIRLTGCLAQVRDVLLDDSHFLFAGPQEEKEGDSDVASEEDSRDGSLQDTSDVDRIKDPDSEEESDLQRASKPAAKRKNDASSLDEQVKRLRDKVMDEWYQKTKFSTSSARRGLESFEVPPTQQIRQIMADEGRLLRRSQLRRSQHQVIGKKESGAASDTKSSKQQNYDSEIFDDDDFYHQLLREVVESKTSETTDSLAISRKWLEIQQLRSRIKKKVDTRASKGRKLRYEVHKELINFMAPYQTFELTDDAKDELFASLFQ